MAKDVLHIQKHVLNFQEPMHNATNSPLLMGHANCLNNSILEVALQRYAKKLRTPTTLMSSVKPIIQVASPTDMDVLQRFRAKMS